MQLDWKAVYKLRAWFHNIFLDATGPWNLYASEQRNKYEGKYIGAVRSTTIATSTTHTTRNTLFWLYHVNIFNFSSLSSRRRPLIASLQNNNTPSTETASALHTASHSLLLLFGDRISYSFWVWRMTEGMLLLDRLLFSSPIHNNNNRQTQQQ